MKPDKTRFPFGQNRAWFINYVKYLKIMQRNHIIYCWTETIRNCKNIKVYSINKKQPFFDKPKQCITYTMAHDEWFI